ncbi:unnamed protein product [Cuscuta europaea]|uniref:Germin-like protein n=1 Tax=Cuscuta europaea TaxID=41803 RepID=A0A9P0ZUB1_CUSEU|nr:unnamed protein product [Cuscuta europaea]
MAFRFFIFAILAITIASFGSASDPSQLQDFCVAINDSKAGVFVNGKICKNPTDVDAGDFFLSAGLNKPGNTSNQLGSAVSAVTVDTLPGLNTLGISLARIDFAHNGVVPPHTHPRASEVLVLLKGTLYVGFVLSNPQPGMKNKLFTKTLYPGDVFVFPQGLIHFQHNIGKSNAVSLSGLSSQNPGVITIGNAVFGSNPPIDSDVLTKAFHVDTKVIEYIQSRF